MLVFLAQITDAVAESADSEAAGTGESPEAVTEFNQVLPTITDTLRQWLDGFLEMLPSLTVALLTLVVFIFVARLVRRGIRGVLDRLSVNSAAARVLAQLAGFATLAGGLIVVLNILQLRQAAMSLVAGAGVVGIAIGFAFQDIAANFISGLALSFYKPFAIGDTIITQGETGTVRAMDLRRTELHTVNGAAVDIPNNQLFTEPLTNLTRQPLRRINVEVGVAYDTDLQFAHDTANEAVKSVEHVASEQPVAVHYTGFGGSSIDMAVRFWITDGTPERFNEAKSEAIMAIKLAFDAADINIPFPIRTLDIPGVPKFETHVVSGKTMGGTSSDKGDAAAKSATTDGAGANSSK